MKEAANLNYHLTAEARRRTVPNLKQLYGLMQLPGMISLAGGVPYSHIFPFDNLRVSSLSPPFENGVMESKLNAEKPLKIQVFESIDDDYDGDIELSTALQYGSAAGDERLTNFLKDHVSVTHRVPYKDWDLILTVGNTFAWDNVLRTFCEPTDTVFFEEYTFPSALENCVTRGCKTVDIKLDEFGMIPSDLEKKAALYHPKLLYCIPTGQNPTGSMLPASRREEICAIARRYDFLIVEDEPYYYLQMRGASNKSHQSNKEFLRSLVPSFVEFDTDGRVIRLDSFSKIMAPGLRMGWIVAQQRFVEALRANAESSSSKPGGFSQSLVYAVLNRWGHDGFVTWLRGLREEYTTRRDACCDAIANYLDTSSIELIKPDAGMFFWLKIPAPHYDRPAHEYEEKFFMEAAENHKVLLVPGTWCKVGAPDEDSRWMYYRGTFASEPVESIRQGVKRLADALADFTNEYVVVNHSDAI